MAAETHAIAVLDKLGIGYEVLRYDYDPLVQDIGLHAAQRLGIAPNLLLKCLMIETPKQALCALIPAHDKLNLKSLASYAQVKQCALMDKDKAQRQTGYVIGGISPLGQKRNTDTFIDESIENEGFIVCNGGKRGLQIKLSPKDLIKATQATLGRLT